MDSLRGMRLASMPYQKAPSGVGERVDGLCLGALDALGGPEPAKGYAHIAFGPEPQGCKGIASNRHPRG